MVNLTLSYFSSFNTLNLMLFLFVSGAIRFPRMQTTSASDTSNADGSKDFKSLELAVACERIDGNTEFVILASTGVWEVIFT